MPIRPRKFGIFAPRLCNNDQMFDWEGMRVFAALAGEGSLAGAARALGVNHATVARRVAALEAALGVTLVTRLARATPLTREGAVIAALAADMEAQAQSILRKARDATATLSGHVTIATSPVLANEIIIPGLGAFHASHPALAIDIWAEPRILALEHGEADLAVRLRRPERADLVTRRLGQMSFALYAAPHIAAQSPETWRFIAFGDALDHVPQQRWLREQLGKRAIHLRTSDLYGQRIAAEAGMGVACLPTILGERSAKLVRAAPGDSPPPRELWLVIHADLRRAPAVRAAADHIIEIFRQNGDLD